VRAPHEKPLPCCTPHCSQCCCRCAGCAARSTRAYPTSSAPASREKPVPRRTQHCSPMLLLPSAMHATSVTHIKCAGLGREAGDRLPSALQPNAAIAAPSAVHAQHERGTSGALAPTRSPHPGALSAAAQCRCRRAKCRASSLYTSVTHVERTSLTPEAGAQPLSALQPNAAVAECDVRSTRA